MSGARNGSFAALCAVAAASLLLAGTRARAEERPGDGVRASAVVEALEAGAPSRAIAVAEALADRGLTGASLAYHRGLAYARRIGTSEEAPGDAGQAIAACLEARALGPSADADARIEVALRAVRSQLARRRSSSGEAPAVEASPGLLRSTLLALSTRAWLVLAATLAVLSSATALAAWRGAGEARASRSFGAAIAGALALFFSWACARAESVRFEESLAVVVTARAPLLEVSTLALTGDDALPEGLAVRVRRDPGATLRLVDRPERAIERTQLRLVETR